MADETPATLELELAARPELVSVARKVMGALVASDPAFSAERAADIRLAVSEVCTNAVQAQARRGARGGGPPIVIRCVVGDERLDVTVTDHGGGFDPADRTVHPLVTDPARLDHEGGLGIPLIQMLADDVVYRPTADGTVVSMAFQPRPAGPAAIVGQLR